MSNLNQVKEKGTKIEINGKERTIKYDLNALAELEENYGTFDEWENKLASSSLVVLRKFLWIGLKHEDENLTEKEVGAAFDMSNLKSIGEVIRDGLLGSMPEASDEEKKTENQTQS